MGWNPFHTGFILCKGCGHPYVPTLCISSTIEFPFLFIVEVSGSSLLFETLQFILLKFRFSPSLVKYYFLG